jgi:predicted TIM-barrel fold metal-dependent hydrolase
MEKIDAHIHFPGDHPDCLRLLDRLEVKVLNICFVHEDNQAAWRSQVEIYQRLAAQSPHRFAWCTSFDLPRFDDPDYIDKVIAGLEQDIKAGAIACKIWKNIGMAVKKPSGEFLMIDDPLFEPIYTYLTRQNITLLLHIGEPLACWQPLVDNHPHYAYYLNNPQWHMYNKPEYPSHQALIEARDRMVAKHPRLRVVGAHLGSLEYDVAEVAKRLDRYPNFAVDTSARLMDLASQDPQAVRQFFRDYAGRILFGTDIVRPNLFSQMTEAERQNELAAMEARYQADFAYFETDRLLTMRDREVQGLGLPENILEKFYVSNAQEWYPGL